MRKSTISMAILKSKLFTVCLLEGKTNAKIHRIFILQIIYKRAMFEIVDEILIR